MEHSTKDKNKTSYTSTSPWSHKIASLDQSVTPYPLPPLCSTLWPLFLFFPLLFFLSILLCRLQCGSACIENDTAAVYPPSVACYSPRRFYWRPYNKRARRRQRQPQASPGGPCLIALPAPGSAQRAAWFTWISLCPPAVSVSSVGFPS